MFYIAFCVDSIDYIYSSTTYEFFAATDTEQVPSTVISIPIIPDDNIEFDETFKLTIVVTDDARASNITEGEISMTDMLIEDDDSETII